MRWCATVAGVGASPSPVARSHSPIHPSPSGRVLCHDLDREGQPGRAIASAQTQRPGSIGFAPVRDDRIPQERSSRPARSWRSLRRPRHRPGRSAAHEGRGERSAQAWRRFTRRHVRPACGDERVSQEHASGGREVPVDQRAPCSSAGGYVTSAVGPIEGSLGRARAHGFPSNVPAARAG